MNRSEWREFLKLYSEEFLSSDWSDQIRLHSSHGAAIPEHARRAGWMGFEPASDDAITAAEDRLARRLPPSLRAFYEVSNGWGMIGSFIFNVLPVEGIGWLKDLDPNLYQIASDHKKPPNELPFKYEKMRAKLEKYFHEQGTMVKRSLAISSWGDAAMWLLDPGDQPHTGEWRAGRWASWSPGMEWRAESFADLMRQELEYNRALKLKEGT